MANKIRGDQIKFLRSLPEFVGPFKVVEVGKFSPGDASSYDAIPAITTEPTSSPVQRFSTHILIRVDDRDEMGRDMWIVYSGHYDMSLERAQQDLETRRA